MPIPFLNSIKLNKNQVEDFCVFNYSGDPTLSSGADFGYLWLNTSATPKVLKFWDGTNYRTLIDSTTISSSTAGTANDLSGGVAGSLPYQQGAGDTTFLGIGSSGYILTSTGSAPQWSASIPSTSVSGLAASATTDTTNASNISSGTLGLARLALASGQFYVGDGSNNPAATAKSSIPLSGFGNAAADINIGGFKITNSGTIGSGDADSTVATKGYVDSVAQGLDVKASCLVATTTDITLASPGAVTIDGIYSATDFTAGTTRILVKDQSAPAENGIYIWQGPSSAMTRSADANTWDELVGAFTFVERGTANADSGWVCTVNAGGTLGTTAVTFVKFSQAGSYTAGNGIVQSGTSFNFAQSAAYTAGQIPFASSTTAMGFNANLHWDNANNRLGIGTATPGTKLDIFEGTGSVALRVRRDANSILDIYHGSGVSYIDASAAGASLVASTAGTERLRIASDGVCTWSNVGGVAGTAMTLNGTGLGVGVVPSVGKLEVNLENGASNSAYFRTTTYTNLRIVGTSGSGATGGSQAFFTTTGNREWVIGQRTDTAYSSANAFFIRDESASATRLSIDTSGNVGIGTTTPSYKLHVNAANPGNGVIAQFYNNATSSLNGASIILTQYGIADWYVGQPAGVSALEFGRDKTSSAAGTGLMRLDSSGNLGLGVTPSAWGTGKPIELSTNGNAIWGLGANSVQIASNYYWASGYKYSNAGYANRYDCGSSTGIHAWFNAPSWNGTGSDAITWTQAMTLDASGNLGIGIATPTSVNANAKTLHVDGAANAAEIRVTNNTTGIASTDGGLLMMAAANLYLQNKENASLLLGTNGTDRLIIDGSGNAGLGVTPANWSSLIGPVLQINNGSFYAYSNEIGISANFKYDGTDKYISNGYATSYTQALGGHYWYSAANNTSGANAALTWGGAKMALDASGRLLIGGTSTYDFAGQANLVVNGTSNNATLTIASTGVGYIAFADGTTGTSRYVGRIDYDHGTDEMFLATNAVERLGIKKNGQVNFRGLASDPAGASAGDIYYNSGSNVFKVYDTGWKTLPRKYSTALAGTSTTFDVTHNLGTQDVTVMVRKSASTFDVVYTDIQVATTNKVTIVFASSVTGSDYTVTVIG